MWRMDRCFGEGWGGYVSDEEEEEEVGVSSGQDGMLLKRKERSL